MVLHVLVVVVLLHGFSSSCRRRNVTNTKQAFSHFLKLFASSTFHDSCTPTEAHVRTQSFRCFVTSKWAHRIFVLFSLCRQPDDGGPIESEIRRHRRRALPNGSTSHPNKTQMPFAAMGECEKSATNKWMFSRAKVNILQQID